MSCSKQQLKPRRYDLIAYGAFSALYRCLMMLLNSAVENRILVIDTELPGATADDVVGHEVSTVFIASTWAAQATQHVMQAASLLRDYRKAYGLKIVLPYIFQASTLCTFTLLNRLGAVLSQPGSPAKNWQCSFHDPPSAFEESLRCLLGLATQVLVARGVVRMVRQTASLMDITLPTSVTGLPKAIAEMAWQSSDIQQIRASYLNYAIAARKRTSEAAGMEDLLRKWEVLSV